ncbi:MAG: hypothetical protein JNK57_21200 [Planctomycetaceae bacterium]|nr:hypothetical protein [Planctomycetaceae bacterium]
MNPKYFWPVVIVVLLAAFPSHALVAQQSVVNLSLDETQPIRWLMLRNGSVFSGQISESQGKYTIQINPQTQMTYDANRAWVVADSLNELYEFHRARVRPGDLNSQMEFARWCITQKLWTEAELEIDAMRAAGVADLQLRGLRLAIAASRPAPPTAQSSLVPSSVNNPIATQGLQPSPNRAVESLPAVSVESNLVAPLPRVPVPSPSLPKPSLPKPAVPAATASLPSPRFQPAADHAETPAPIVNSVFSFYDQPGFENDTRVQEAISESVDQKAVDQFNETVQWSVVQACAGCHYPENERLAQASSFALEIPSAKHKATLEQTRHNLAQLLPLINRDNPGNSRLVDLLAQPHGTLKQPPLAAESEDYRAIMQWIYRSEISRSSSQSSPRSHVGSLGDPALPNQSGSEMESHVIQAHAETTEVDQLPTPTSADIGPLPRLIPGSLGPEIDPNRPYSPEPFNRLYHPDGPVASIESPAPTTPPSPAPRWEQLPPVGQSLTPQTLPPPALTPQTLTPQTLSPQTLMPQNSTPPTSAPQTLSPQLPAPHRSEVVPSNRLQPPSGIPRVRREASPLGSGSSGLKPR